MIAQYYDITLHEKVAGSRVMGVFAPGIASGNAPPPSIAAVVALARHMDARVPIRLMCHHHSPGIPTFALKLREKLPTTPKLSRKKERKVMLQRDLTVVEGNYVRVPLTPAIVELWAKKSPVLLEHGQCRAEPPCTVESILLSCVEERANEPVL